MQLGHQYRNNIKNARNVISLICCFYKYTCIGFRTETQKLKEEVDELTKGGEEKIKTINQVFFSYVH